MAVITVTGTSNAQLRTNLINEINRNVTRTADIIQIGPGTIESFLFPRNLSNTTFVPLDPDNPPVFRGVGMGVGNPKGNLEGCMRGNDPTTTGQTFSNIEFNGLTFYGARLTQIIRNDNTVVQTRAPDGQGYAFRVDKSYPQFSGSGGAPQGQAGGVHLLVVSGNNIRVRNNYFNGGATQLKCGGTNQIVEQNDFDACCEDHIKTAGGTNLTIRWNRGYGFRGMSLAMAQNAHDWKDQAPPHSDFFQVIGKCVDGYFGYNWLHDMSTRVHMALITIPRNYQDPNDVASPGEQNNGFIVENNLAESSHNTGIIIHDVQNLLCRRNKFLQIATGGTSDSKVSLKIGITKFGIHAPNLGADNADVPNPEVYDNMAVNIDPGFSDKPSQWTQFANSNAQNNNASLFPAGWVNIKKGQPGATRWAGVGGNDGDVVPPTGPAPLTAAQWSIYGEAKDPLLAASDPRRTLVIAIPANSPAFAASEIRWQNAIDAGARGTAEIGVGPQGQRLFRMTSTGDFHLRTPGAAPPGNQFVDIGLYWYAAQGGVRSARSTNQVTRTLAYTPGTFDPKLTNEVDFSIVLGMMRNDVQYGAIKVNETVIWTKP